MTEAKRLTPKMEPAMPGLAGGLLLGAGRIESSPPNHPSRPASYLRQPGCYVLMTTIDRPQALM